MSTKRTLGAILFHDFELLDYYGPLEMFGNLGKDLSIVTIGEHQGPIKSAQGPSTLAEFDFSNAPALDLVLLPGGIGTIEQLESEAMLNFVRDSAANAETVMSVCTGSAILGAAGVLDGKRATSNKLFFEMASTQGSDVNWVENARWVEDGKFLTSSGVSAGTDMSLGVIAQMFGRERAEQIAVMTEYEWHADASEDPFSQYLNQGNIEEYLQALGRA